MHSFILNISEFLFKIFLRSINNTIVYYFLNSEEILKNLAFNLK